MRRFLTLADTCLLYVATVCFGGFLVCVALQVFFRYVLERPLSWSEEVSVYLFIWSSFLAAAVLVGKNDHFSIPIFVAMLPSRAQRVIDLIGVLLCLTFSLIVVLKSSAWSYRMLPFFTPILQLSQGAVYAVLPFCGLYMVIHLVVRLIEIVRPPSQS